MPTLRPNTIRRKLLAYVAVPVVALAAVAAWEDQAFQRHVARSARQALMTERAIVSATVLHRHLRALEQLTSSTAALVSRHPEFDEDDLYDHLESCLQQNRLIFGAAVAFEPYVFRQGQRLFSPYVYRTDLGLARKSGSDDYDYTAPRWEWYDVPRRGGGALWTDPYNDEGGGNVRMVTYSVPFHREGRFAGVATVDIALEPLQDLAFAEAAGEERVAVVTADGRFVYHPDPDRIQVGSLVDVLGGSAAQVDEATAAIQGGQAGAIHATWQGAEDTWIVYAPVPAVGWTFLTWKPAEEAMADIDRRSRFQVTGILALIAAMAGFIWVAARRLSTPIEALTAAAERLARGELEARALVSGEGELATLADALNSMAGSLQQRDRELAEERRRRFGELLDGLSGRYFYYTRDRSGNWTYVSAAVLDVLGCSPGSFAAQASDLLTDHPVNRDQDQHFERLLRGEAVPARQMEMRHADGSPRRLEVFERPLLGSAVHVVGVEGVVCDITDRVADAERLRSLLESMPDGMVIVDERGIIRLVNERAKDLFGYDGEELQGQPAEILVADTSRRAYAELQIAFRRDGGAHSAGQEMTARRRDGSEFPVEIGLSPVQLEEGRGVFAAVRDTSEKVEAERAARDSQAFLQSVVDNSTALIFAKDLQGRYILTNRPWQSALGLPTPGIGRTDHELFPAEAADEIVANDKHVLGSQEPISAEETILLGGVERTFLSVKFPILDEEGRPMAVCGISSEITDRKQAEARERTLAQFRQAVWRLDSSSQTQDILDDLAWVLAQLGVEYDTARLCLSEDNGGMVCHEHRRHGGTWEAGPVPDDLVGASVAEASTTSDADGSRTRLPFLHGILELHKSDRRAFDGHEEALQAVVTTLGEAFSRFGDLQALRDRTRQAEEARQTADRANATKSLFLANMSHEIRTPMNAILGFAEILGGLVRDPQQHHYLTTIQTSGRALLGLINDILDLSKVEAGKLELTPAPADLGQAVREMESIFAQRFEEKSLRLEVDVDPRVPRAVLIDEARVRQILVNLVGNAVKFTEAGGVRLALLAGTGAAAPGDRIDLSIEVSDTGIGIPQDQQERIFGAFEQTEGQSHTRFGGTGLGLAITRRLVEMMGGTVRVNSVVGEGSTFTVRLPQVEVVAEADLKSAQDDADIDGLRFERALLLLADDDDTGREVTRVHLSEYGFEILEAANGQEAMEAARRQPSLILMDMRMPVLGGLEAARRLKQDVSTQEIPIVALTASVMDSDVAEILTVCDGLLRKPATKAQLVNEIARFLPHTREESRPVVAESPKPTAAERPPAPEGLVEALRGEREAWQSLVDSREITDIEAFAVRIRKLESRFGWVPLRDWAQRLETQAASFDLAHLPATLAEFTELLGDDAV